MRAHFVQTLLELAKQDKRLILMTGDLGFSIFEEFQKECPQQFFNAGVAEQNMTGLAAGMAIEGFSPWFYSIIPFVTMRNFEQIRNDICYQNLNVKITGVGVGFTFGPYGHTHHALEDVGILRTLPNMVILAPGDPIEARLATIAAYRHIGPVFIRFGRVGTPIVHTKEPKFEIGKGIIVRDGQEVTLFASSTMLVRGLEVAKTLESKRISTRLISMPTIKPLDEGLIRKCAKETKAIFTIEEHSVIGGLGTAVAEVLAESGSKVIFKRFGVPDRFTKVIGKQEFMLKANGLAADQIVQRILKTIL